MLGLSRTKTVKKLEQEIADLEKNYKRLEYVHSTKFRIGTIRLDLLKIQSDLRGEIEPSIKIEQDGQKIVVYADVELSEGDANRVGTMLVPEFDRS